MAAVRPTFGAIPGAAEHLAIERTISFRVSRARGAVEAASVATDHLVRDRGHGKVLFPEPTAGRIGVPKLPPDALARIIVRLEFDCQCTQVRSHWTRPHPIQNMGCCEISFDQILLLPARSADRKGSHAIFGEPTS